MIIWPCSCSYPMAAAPWKLGSKWIKSLDWTVVALQGCWHVMSRYCCKVARQGCQVSDFRQKNVHSYCASISWIGLALMLLIVIKVIWLVKRTRPTLKKAIVTHHFFIHKERFNYLKISRKNVDCFDNNSWLTFGGTFVRRHVSVNCTTMVA